MKTSALFVWPLLGVLGLWATLLPAALGASPADELPPVVAGSAWGSGTTRLAPALLASIAETKVRQAARTAYLSAEGLAYGAKFLSTSNATTIGKAACAVRNHSSLGYKSPDQFENEYHTKLANSVCRQTGPPQCFESPLFPFYSTD